MPTTQEVQNWRGRTMVGPEGKIGKIDDVYLDAETGQPEWALVNTGLFGTSSSFVPIAEATSEGDDIRVPYDKDTVKGAPNMEADDRLSQEEESTLYRHYGLSYSESASDTGLPEGGAGVDRTHRTTEGEVGRDRATTGDDIGRDRGTVGDDVSGRETDDAMTRSEEEVTVGTTQRETGRLRLRKYIVEDEVTQTVPVRREEVRLEREPITDANAGDALSGADLSEEEHEVTLHEEQAVVEKRVVPKERVRLDKDVTQEEQTVSETVRKEQVEMLDADGEPAEGRDGRRGTDEGI